MSGRFAISAVDRSPLLSWATPGSVVGPTGAVVVVVGRTVAGVLRPVVIVLDAVLGWRSGGAPGRGEAASSAIIVDRKGGVIFVLVIGGFWLSWGRRFDGHNRLFVRSTFKENFGNPDHFCIVIRSLVVEVLDDVVRQCRFVDLHLDHVEAGLAKSFEQGLVGVVVGNGAEDDRAFLRTHELVVASEEIVDLLVVSKETISVVQSELSFGVGVPSRIILSHKFFDKKRSQGLPGFSPVGNRIFFAIKPKAGLALEGFLHPVVGLSLSGLVVFDVGVDQVGEIPGRNGVSGRIVREGRDPDVFKFKLSNSVLGGGFSHVERGILFTERWFELEWVRGP